MGDTEINSARRLLLELLDFLRYGNNLELHPTFLTFMKPISMKNIIQITLAIVVFLLLIFVVKNTFFKEKNCLEDYPEIIKKYHLEGKYDTAKWELYVLNCMLEPDYLVYNDDEFNKIASYKPSNEKYWTFNPKYEDEKALRKAVGDDKVVKYIECGLEPFDMDSSTIYKKEREIRLTFFPRTEQHGFLQKLRGKYSYTIIFENDTIKKVGMNDYVEMLYSQNRIADLNNKFESYLNENHDVATAGSNNTTKSIKKTP